MPNPSQCPTTANTLPTTYQRSAKTVTPSYQRFAKTINTTYQRFANTQHMPSQYTAHALPALPGQGYGPKLMFLLLSTALKEKGKKNGHTEYMANFF